MKIEYKYNDKYIEEFDPDYDLVIIYNDKKEYELFRQIIKDIHLDIHDCIEYGDVELICSLSESDFETLKGRCLNLNIILERESENEREL